MALREGWVLSSLNELVDQVKDSVKVLDDNSYRLLGVRWYGNGPFIREVVTNKTSKANRLFPVNKGDFIYNRLFAWKGSFGLIPDELEGCFVSQEFPLFRVRKQKLDANYLNLIMCQPSKWSQIEIESTGSTSVSRNRWKEARFLEQKVWLPPLVEQKRIVDLVSSVDSYIDSLQSQVDAARIARNAMLHELLSAAGDDWTETTLGEISGFISNRLAPQNLDPATPYVGLEHIDPKTTMISRWGVTSAVSSSVTPFEPEDTLFGRLRPYLHKVSIADFPGVCSPEVLVLRVNDSCEPRFLHLLCSLDSTIQTCIEKSAGTRMPRTSTADLGSILILLPPKTEQEQIVEIISSMDDLIHASEKAVTDAKTLRSGLLSDLLSGEHEIPTSYDKLMGDS